MSGFASKKQFPSFVFFSNFSKRIPERKEINLDSETSSIYENAFAFYGSVSPDGFLLELGGTIFKLHENLVEPELLIGHRFTDTVFWQSNPYVADRLQNAIGEAAKGFTTRTELEFRIAAQDIHTIDIILIPQLNEAGEVSKIAFCAYDATDRAREVEFYKKRSEQFLYAAEYADIGLWFWDISKNEIFSTPKCNEFFGLAPHEIITIDYFLDSIHFEDKDRVAKDLEDVRRGEKILNTEFRVICPDGKVQWLTVRGNAYFENDYEKLPASITGIVQKVTDRKIADEELKKIYEREKKARDEAEEANRAKDYFLAIVSHELRTPLNSILGWTKILLTKEVDEKTQRSALETIERSAKSQAKLIEDLVDMARVASGKLRLEMRPLNLYDILQTVCNQHKPLAETRNIHLDLESNSKTAEVFGDSIRLQQVFSNLVSNAMKFTPEGGKIKLEMRSNGDFVQSSVIDTGRGIEPEFLPNIFRQFAQGDPKNSGDRSGLGLGLAIVKTLVEKHNGSVVAQSDGIGHGASFTVTLPLHSAVGYKTVSKQPKREARQNQPKLNNVNILLVEDDPDSRDVLTLYLEQCGAKIRGAESAQEAFQYLTETKNGKYDIIISDLAMPGEDGFTFLCKVRSLPEESGGKIPAIALSAFTTSENKEKAYISGFQKYHTKPFEPDLLISEIAELVGK
jgi:PAS domain S-box-containing protein